jgi:oligosaccharide reducing-end xylanase
MIRSRVQRARRFASALTLAFALGALVVLGGCGGTLDSLGADPSANADSGATPQPLQALSGPSGYRNAFAELLGKSDADINAKLDSAFAALFHGDPATQAIYFSVGTNQAYVEDVLHGDVRSEGSGVLMLIAVELDKQDEFDRLWAYAKTTLEVQSGPAEGYFNSFCDDATPCIDPYGMEQFVTALLFANDRWGNGGAVPYAKDASTLLDLLQNKERENGGASSGTTSAFDEATSLVREQPTVATAGYTRSALEIPAMYELWAEASGNAFWSAAASAARAHLVASADPITGLWPMRSYFDGSPVPNFDTYSPQAYRTPINLALDALWGTGTPDGTAIANRLLAFFTSQGLANYGTTFTLDGATLDPSREQGLVAVNGALAVAATAANRADFVNAVWAMPIPTGEARYYDGILYLLSLLVLSGECHVY